MEYLPCIHRTGIFYLPFFYKSTIHCTLPKFKHGSPENDGFQSRNLLVQGASIFRWTMLNFTRGRWIYQSRGCPSRKNGTAKRFEQPMDEDISRTKTWVANESVVALCFFFGICYIPQQTGENISNLTCGYFSKGLCSSTNNSYIDAFQVWKYYLPFAKLQQLRIMWRIRSLGSTPTC